MRTETPLATPAVAAPHLELGSAPNGTVPKLLEAPIVVLTPWGALDLDQGSLLIGRLPECDICLNDELVSRMHARISVQDESVLIEDLHSTNGIYINRGRVQQQIRACEGDRLLIGSTELSIFQAQQQPRREPSTQWPARASAERATESRPTAPPPPIPTTTKSNALQLIGGLADRLAADGSLQEAAEVLSEHLKGIQRGAIAGLTITDTQVACASEYALRLAAWTSRVGWVEYVVELHLSARALMSDSVLCQFERALDRFTSLDRGLLEYYVEQQQQRRHATDDDRERLSRLVELTRR